jgi:S1-C subfamily serine protease
MSLRLPLSLIAAGLLLGASAGIPTLAAPQEAPALRTTLETLAQSTPTDIQGTVENSTAQIFVTAAYPDPFKPWTVQPAPPRVLCGVIIDGKRILCNAHGLMYATDIKVQAKGGAKLTATVAFVAPGIDLAVLKLSDESLFEAHPPLARTPELPSPGAEALMFSFPANGDRLSVNRATLPREGGVEFAPYTYPAAGLRLQFKLSTEPGSSSGGPLMVNGKMAGLAYAFRSGSENIGYAVPCEEIDIFLKDIADGRYDGKPALYDELQTMDSPFLRTFLGLAQTNHGIVVHKAAGKDPSHPLKEWDLITRIGDTPIDDRGTVQLGEWPVRFQYLVQKLERNGKVPLTIMRGGQELRIDMPVNVSYPLVMPDLQGTAPSYFIYGPIVFSSASVQLFSTLGQSAAGGNILSVLSASGSPLVQRVGDTQAFPGEELVVVPTGFFSDPITTGYSDPRLQVVKSINGVPVRNLKHLVEVLRDSREQFIRIEFNTRRSETFVFPREQMNRVTAEVLDKNNMRRQGSPEIMTVWDAKK